MIRRVSLPIVYFIFGMFVAFIESEFVGTLISKGVSVVTINNITPWIFIITLFLLVYFEVLPQFKKTNQKPYKYLYLVITIALLSFSAYYWITYLVWK